MALDQLLDPSGPADSLLESIPEVMCVLSHRRELSHNYFSENIRSIAEFIVPGDDYRTIDAIHDQIDEDEAERREVLEQAHADLKGLYLLAPGLYYVLI
jgi:hypothetical protein